MDAQDAKRGHYRAALNKQLTDATRALKVFESPGWEDVRKYWSEAVQTHEQLLHNANVDEKSRERSCWSLIVYRRVLDTKRHFEALRDESRRKLSELDKTPSKEKDEADVLIFQR